MRVLSAKAVLSWEKKNMLKDYNLKENLKITLKNGDAFITTTYSWFTLNREYSTCEEWCVDRTAPNITVVGSVLKLKERYPDSAIWGKFVLHLYRKSVHYRQHTVQIIPILQELLLLPPVTLTCKLLFYVQGATYRKLIIMMAHVWSFY